MFSEISVTIKDDEKRLNKKFTSYEEYVIEENDSVIKSCIEEVLANFNGKPDSIKVNITLDMT